MNGENSKRKEVNYIKTTTEAYLLSFEVRNPYTNKAGKSVPEKYGLTFLGAADRKLYYFVIEQKPVWINELLDGKYLAGTLEMDVHKNDFKSDNYGDAYTMVYASFLDRAQVEFTSA